MWFFRPGLFPLKMEGWRIMVQSSDRSKIVLILLIILFLPSCTSRVISGPVYFYPKVEPIDIELKSFSFQPNHIAILKDQSPFTFRLINTAQIKHNFTLTDTRENILISVDLMPNKSSTVTIEPLEPGNYTFYCNRFLHRRGGMEGMLMVD
jgi:plastocyanin